MNSKALFPLCLIVPLFILFLVFLPRQEPLVASDGGALFVTSWGSNVRGNGEFKKPLGIVADSSGLVYVADSRNNRIQVFNASGTFITAWGSFGSGNGEFNLPSDVALSPDGNLYVADTQNQRIQVFTPVSTPGDDTGVFVSCFIATAAFGSALEPRVVALREFRDLYLLPSTSGRVFVELYYALSPPLADRVAADENLRAAARAVLAPVADASDALLGAGSRTVGIFGWLGAAVILLCGIGRRKAPPAEKSH